MATLKNKKGFTLIELVVVIALMAVLSLIIVPNVTKYRGKADESKIKSEMLNVYLGAEAVAEGYSTKNETENAIKANGYKVLKEYTRLKSFTAYTFTANPDGSLAYIRYNKDGYNLIFNGDTDDFIK